MKVRILFKDGFYWPQGKGRFFWRYCYEEYKGEQDRISYTDESFAENFIKKKSWLKKPKRIIKEFEI